MRSFFFSFFFFLLTSSAFASDNSSSIFIEHIGHTPFVVDAFMTMSLIIILAVASIWVIKKIIKVVNRP